MNSAKQNSGLKSVFFGTPEFAAHILEYLVEQSEHVVAAVTIPDKQQGRGLKFKSSAVKETAQRHNILVLQPEKLKDPAFHDQLKALDADVFVVVAFKILPRDVFMIPPKGSFNIHASLLPKYRGAAPINWAIMNGEKETGITTFLLEEKVDTGNVLLKESTPITPDETAGELHDNLMEIGARLAHKTLLGLASGSIQPQRQSNEEATAAPKIFPADCLINFDMPAEKVHDFIRGLSPYPGAVATHNGVRIKLLRTRIQADMPHVEVGSFIASGKQLFVGTETSPIEILELQREGKAPMTAELFLRGDRTLFNTTTV